jgi:hypothetical protein
VSVSVDSAVTRPPDVQFNLIGLNKAEERNLAAACERAEIGGQRCTMLGSRAALRARDSELTPC